jgi:hypothetical protein
MGTIVDSLGMTSYTLAILFFALKTIVKKLLSIEIVIFHTFTLSEVLSDTFPDFLGMTFYTLAILLSALKPIVKLFSLEIVIFHTCTLLFYLKKMLIN